MLIAYLYLLESATLTIAHAKIDRLLRF